MSNLIKEKCKSLRLEYVSDIYGKIPFECPEQYVTVLLQQELELREAAKGERLIKKTKFMNEKGFINYQCSEHIRFPPQLDRQTLESLYFIDKKVNSTLTGNPGTGKSYLVTVLCRKAD